MTFDLSKVAQIGNKTAEVVFTTEDSAFEVAGDKSQPPVLNGKEVQFSRASAIVLRVKA